MTDVAPPKLAAHHASPEMEVALIGALITQSDNWDLVASALSPDDFSIAANRLLFDLIARTARRNPVWDANMLVSDIRSEYRDPGTLLAQMGAALTAANRVRVNVPTYCRTLRALATLRRLEVAADDIRRIASEGSQHDVDAALSQAGQVIETIGEQHFGGSSDDGDMTSVLREVVDDVKSPMSPDTLTGVSYGIAELDEMTGGAHGNELIILGGRPSMGKTALATKFMLAALKASKRVVFFSLEMSRKELAQRALSILADVETKRIRARTASEVDVFAIEKAVESAVADASTQLKWKVFDKGHDTPAAMLATARREKRKHGLDMILVDYLQMMSEPSEKGAGNRANEVSAISRALKRLAKELDIPVIALAQINRGNTDRADKRPVMSDLRESGAIEQDADVIMFVHREAYYNSEAPADEAEIIICKQRNGPVGTVKVGWDPTKTQFFDTQGQLKPVRGPHMETYSVDDFDDGADAALPPRAPDPVIRAARITSPASSQAAPVAASGALSAGRPAPGSTSGSASGPTPGSMPGPIPGPTPGPMPPPPPPPRPQSGRPAPVAGAKPPPSLPSNGSAQAAAIEDPLEVVDGAGNLNMRNFL